MEGTTGEVHTSAQPAGGVNQPSDNAESKPVVLFYTDNGLGLGHLTRQAAVALRANGEFRPVFLTMSAGYPLLRQLELPAEYFPSYGRLGITKQQWEPVISRRVLETIGYTGARVVVMDHVSPPSILRSVRARAKEVRFIWARRGLWQPGKNLGALRMSDSFDLVIEPGDLASPIDQGATVERRPQTKGTDPIILVDRSQYLTRSEARDELGIPQSGTAILVNLGDSDPAEIARLVSHTRLVATSVTTEPLHFFAPLHPLHGERIPRVEGVTMAPVYPIARYFNGFDAAVSTAGYNSFHEIIDSRLPAVFVPHRGASIDDQVRRAEFAALSGRAHWAPDILDPSFADAVRHMLRPGERAIAEMTTDVLGPMNGALEFAGIIADLARSSPASHSLAETPATPDRFRNRSTGVPRHDATTTLIVALEHDSEQLSSLARLLASADAPSAVVLVRDGDAGSLYEGGIIFESAITETEWASVGRSSYSEYIETRIAEMTKRYEASRTIAPPPGSLSELVHGTRRTR